MLSPFSAAAICRISLMIDYGYQIFKGENVEEGKLNFGQGLSDLLINLCVSKQSFLKKSKRRSSILQFWLFIFPDPPQPYPVTVNFAITDFSSLKIVH